jgi:hypothetical protein
MSLADPSHHRYVYPFMSSLLLGLLLFQVAGSPPDPRGAIRAATQAVERDGRRRRSNRPD